MFSILGLLLVFHTLIFTQVIPYNIVWAGKLNSIEEMKRFETISILINILILTVLIIKYRLLEKVKVNQIIDLLIWGFVILFTLNTVGNLFAKNMLELILGTFLTMISAMLCFVIVRKVK